VAELRLPPSPLERALGQLIEAGLARPGDLATYLGLEPRQVARPLRKLSQAGVLHRDPDNGLKLTPEGRAWLSVEPILPGDDTAVTGKAPAAPRLSPLRLEPGADPFSLDPGDLETSTESGVGWRRLRLPRPQALHRVAAVAAAAIVLVTGFQSGLLPSALAMIGSSDRSSHAQAEEQTMLSSPPSDPVPRDQWMLVQYTEGQGLVLRPEPASTVGLRTLPEGTRVRITGAALQVGDRTWVPVEALDYQEGWVAAEFLAATL
jgi:hypothetical protein